MSFAGHIVGLTQSAHDRDWVLPALLFVLLQHGLLLVVSRAVSFNEPVPTWPYQVVAVLLSMAAGLPILFYKLFKLWRADEDHPLAVLNWRAGLFYLLGFQLVALQIGALTWAKEMLPVVTPFWADAGLADLERFVFGRDAWRLIPAITIRPLDTIYPTWALVKFGTLFVVLSAPPSAFKVRAMMTYFLIMGVLGTAGIFVLPSVGPILFDSAHGGHRFAELSSMLSDRAPIASSTSDYLRSGHIFGGGISAMPSMHVATSAWCALALAGMFQRLKLVGWTFWLLILIGSVGLGWHYVSDGIVGTAGALIFWHFSKTGRKSGKLSCETSERRSAPAT
jgi:hypothetical protein